LAFSYSLLLTYKINFFAFTVSDQIKSYFILVAYSKNGFQLFWNILYFLITTWLAQKQIGLSIRRGYREKSVLLLREQKSTFFLVFVCSFQHYDLSVTPRGRLLNT
jgi:hypothetical protein